MLFLCFSRVKILHTAPLNTNNKKNSAFTLFSLAEKVLYFSVFTLVLNTVFCNAQILLDGPCFHFAKLKRFVGLDEKKHSHFRCANVRGLCGSTHRKLLFYSSASSRPKFILLFCARCGKVFTLNHTSAHSILLQASPHTGRYIIIIVE